MRALSILPLALVACGFQDDPFDEEVVVTDDAELLAAVSGLSPEALADTLDDPRAQLGVDPDCDRALSPLSPEGMGSGPRLDDPAVEVWSAGCDFARGVELDGMLTWTRADDGVVLVAEDAVLRRDGVVELVLDGVIELAEVGDQLLLDVSASWCGPGGPTCDLDPLTVDLDYSLFPAVGFPQAYDLTVSGLVGTADAAISVEGAWSIDEAACLDEPANGVLALRGGVRHALEMDGAERCDGCATHVVQGQRAPDWCALDL